MTRPGERLRRLAARVCSERTRRRLFDPAVADLQAEVAAAQRTGSAWRTMRALGVGYLAIAKVLAIAASVDLLHGVRAWERREAAALWRGAWVAAAIITVATALLELPMLVALSSQNSGIAARVQMASYLAPSTLALTVPLGLAIATAWVVNGAGRRRKMAAVALIAATATSLAMFANIGWLAPDANQAFREAVMAHHDPPARGDGELRLGELRDRLRDMWARDGDQPNVRALETLYYRKWAASVTPLASVGLMLAVAFRRRWTLAGITSVACGLWIAQYAMWISTFWLAQSSVAPPVVLEWTFNATCAIATVALTSKRRPA